MKYSYASAGVDVKEADLFVKAIKAFMPNPKSLGAIGAFGSLYDLGSIIKKYKHPILVSSTDGVGTKLKIAQELGIHHTVGVDLVAMNVNDVICLGAKPLFFLDYIACGKLDKTVLTTVVRGINVGLKQSACVLLGGETAEMPGMYGDDEYDLAGFCVGIIDQERMLTGKNISAGDLVVGISSSGFHSNGFSLVRKALGINGIKEYGKQLLKPTRIYVESILSLLNAYPSPFNAVKAIAHVTGGAFYSKATKVLPSGYAMVVNKKSWRVPSIFRVVQEKGNIDEKEMYSVFNMGIGMILVVKAAAVNSVVNHLNKFYPTRVIGEIVKSKEKMKIV